VAETDIPIAELRERVDRALDRQREHYASTAPEARRGRSRMTSAGKRRMIEANLQRAAEFAPDSPIRAMRVARGWSLHDLAMRAGIHRNTVARAERREGRTSPSTLRALALVLGVPRRALKS
jgi:ribosome-binding protein aMBF1 (putative translation factor)